MARDWKTNPAQTYGNLCKDVIGLQGYKPGEVPVINRKDHPQQWREWYAYYKLRGLKFSMELMCERDAKTVPTHSPFNFDAEFSLPTALPEVPNNRFPPSQDMSPERMARHARLMSSFTGRSIQPPAGQP